MYNIKCKSLKYEHLTVSIKKGTNYPLGYNAV
jgi:hypothetical protein